jgi:hypothetical protein
MRLALVCGAASVAAQPAAQRAATPSWTVSAPDAALAWFSVLADWRIDGDGAFSYINPAAAEQMSSERDESLVRRLRSEPARAVLHFAPLYYPSASRTALALALRAAGASSAPSEPRATFLHSALERTMPVTARRAYLAPLATALEDAVVEAPSAERLARWQQVLDSLYLPALAPHLARERLDAGRVIVAPALGAEGRLFAATADRTDNLVAVGAFAADPDPEAPLLAFVREICFPAVSRAASAARLGPSSPNAARRSSLAAVRCGAALLEACLPNRADAYRAFWVRQADRAGLSTQRARGAALAPAVRAEFDRLFPADAALAVRVGCERSVVPRRP